MRLVSTDTLAEDRNPSPSPNVDDAHILRLFSLSQTREAMALLVERDGRLIYGFCFRLMRDATEAEDVMQTVFIEACRDLKTFAAKSSLRGWLMGIAHHRCLDALKSRRTAPRHDNVVELMNAMPSESAEPSDSIDTQRKLRALEDCLGRLSDDVRSTVLLRFQSGLSYEALAREMRQQPATLQARVARALPVLRECLEKKGLEP